MLYSQKTIVRTFVHLVLLAACVASNAKSARAQVDSSPMEKSCSSFSSARQYAAEASLYCLKTGGSPHCDRAAAEHFQACKFKGDYHRLNQNLMAKTLMLFVMRAAGRTSGDTERSRS